MSNFFNNLNQREKYLILSALTFLLVFMIFSISTHLVSSLDISNKQLSKAKSDYEYVLESEVIQENNNLKIIFTTKDLKDSIAISDEVSGKINKVLDTVEYSKIDNKSQTILFFN